jgi:hypothetical protein
MARQRQSASVEVPALPAGAFSPKVPSCGYLVEGARGSEALMLLPSITRSSRIRVCSWTRTVSLTSVFFPPADDTSPGGDPDHRAHNHGH